MKLPSNCVVYQVVTPPKRDRRWAVCPRLPRRARKQSLHRTTGGVLDERRYAKRTYPSRGQCSKGLGPAHFLFTHTIVCIPPSREHLCLRHICKKNHNQLPADQLVLRTTPVSAAGKPANHDKIGSQYTSAV